VPKICKVVPDAGVIEGAVKVPVVTLIDDTLIVDAVLSVLTLSVEKAPVPGGLLLILDTVSVDRVRKDALILDMIMVEPNNVEPVIVDNFRVVTVSVGTALLRSARKFDILWRREIMCHPQASQT
jgi:hypothetical protein